jgi:hypothetical protein
MAKASSGKRVVVFRLISICAIFLLVSIVLADANPATNLPKIDSGTFEYIVQQILRHKLPYRDVWDSKPPAIFYVNALGLWIGKGSRWGIFAIEFASLFIATGLAFWFLKKQWGLPAAWFGTFTWLYGLSNTIQGGNLTEEYPLVFHFLAFILLTALFWHPKRRCLQFLLGLSFSVSFLFRPNNSMVEFSAVLAYIVILVLKKRSKDLMSGLLFLGSGVAIPLAFVAIYFWHYGLLRDLFDAVIIYNLSYAATKISALNPLIFGSDVLGISLWLGIVGYIFLLINIRSFIFEKGSELNIALLIGWPLAIITVDPSGRGYPHYFTNWVPFIALLSTIVYSKALSIIWVSRLKNLLVRQIMISSIALFLAVIVFIGSGSFSLYAKVVRSLSNPENRERFSVISDYVRFHTDPGDYVLFWAARPGENFMSRRSAPSAYILYPILVSSPITEQFNIQFLRDLKRNQPILIVDLNDPYNLSLDPAIRNNQILKKEKWSSMPDNINEVFYYIDTNYSLERTVAGASIYMLRGTK